MWCCCKLSQNKMSNWQHVTPVIWFLDEIFCSKWQKREFNPIAHCDSPGSFIIKVGESVPPVPAVSFCCRCGVTLSRTLEFSYFFSLPQHTFTSHSSLLESSLLLGAPWEHLWLPCCPGGSRDSAVWSLRSTLGLSGNSTGPLEPPRLHALKPIYPPPPSFSLDSAFALLFSPLLPPPSLGHWCQTDLLCAGACFCSCADEQMNARVGVSSSFLLFL